MKLINQPNRWSCLPTAICMLLDIEYSDLIHKVGHDGSEILFPDLPEPERRRSFHIEEFQYILPSFGFLLVHYVPGVIYAPTKEHKREIDFTKQFLNIINREDGLVFGIPTNKILGHVVAWNAAEGLIYDPNGTKYSPAENFTIQYFYRAIKCNR